MKIFLEILKVFETLTIIPVAKQTPSSLQKDGFVWFPEQTALGSTTVNGVIA